MVDGVTDQVGSLMDIKFVHDAGAVTVRGFHTDAEAVDTENPVQIENAGFLRS
jgi:hypothetical protein